MVHIFGAIAEFELALIRERTVTGLRAAHEQGRRGGRPKAMSDADIEVARLLMHNLDISMAEIAKRVEVSLPTLYEYFRGGRAKVLRDVKP